MSLVTPTNAATSQSEGQRPADSAAGIASANDERDCSPPDVGVRGDETNDTAVQSQETALHRLIRDEEKDEDALQKLKNGEVPWTDQLDTPLLPSQETALYMAIRKGFSKVASWLISVGADVNVPEDEGNQSVHMACYAGEEALLALLLDNGAEVGHANHEGWYPLHFASLKGISGVVLRLLGPQGPTIDQVEPGEGWTPLNIATYFGHEEVVEVLITNGARLDIPDSAGWTPFTTAIKQGNYDILNKLLDHSKTTEDAINIPDHEGGTPLLNLYANLPEEVEPLQKAKQAVEKLLNLGAKVNVTDNLRRTVLHYAMRDALETKTSRLARQVFASTADAKLLLVDKDGETAFDAAFNEDTTVTEDAPVNEDAPVKKDVAAKKDTAVKKDAALDLEFISDFLIERLSSETDLSDLLCWAAQSPKRHKIATRILSQDLTEEESSQFRDTNPAQWTIFEWAIYHRRPRVLWAAISAPRRESLTKEDIDIGKAMSNGKKLLKELKEKASSSNSIFNLRPANKKDSQGTKSNEKAVGDETKVLRIMSDMIDFLHVEKSTRPEETTALSKPDERMTQSSEEFYAAIVQMRQDKTKLKRYAKFRTVKEVLYESDPIETVLDTEKRFQEFAYWPNDASGSTKPSPAGEDTKNGTEFTWIHFPSTNMVWMMDAMKKITAQDSPEAFPEVASFLRHSWVQIPDGMSTSRFMRPRYVVKSNTQEGTEGGTFRVRNSPGERQTFKITADLSDQRDKGSKKTPTTATCDTSTSQKPVDITAIYVPYLYFSVYHKNETEQQSGEQESSTGRIHQKNHFKAGQDEKEATDNSNSVPDEVLRRRSLFKAYEKEVIHQSSTLDEFYYHFATDPDSLLDQQERNRKQVVTNYLPREGPNTWRLLRVSQLWIWIIADKWLITSTSCATGAVRDSLVVEILEHLQKETENGNHWCGPSSATEMSRVIVDYCIGAYDRKRPAADADPSKSGMFAKDSPSPGGDKKKSSKVPKDPRSSLKDGARKTERSIRQIFSDSINQIGRKEVDLFRLFCDDQSKGDSIAGFKGDQTEPTIISGLQETLKRIVQLLLRVKDDSGDQSRPAKDRVRGNQTQPLTSERLQVAAKKAANLLFEIKDVRDELNILKTIAEYQRKVQTSMARIETNAPAEEDLTAKYVCNDIRELDKTAEQTQASLHTTIALQESEIANLQAKEAVNQGKTVMVFTLVTVWFVSDFCPFSLFPIVPRTHLFHLATSVISNLFIRLGRPILPQRPSVVSGRYIYCAFDLPGIGGRKNRKEMLRIVNWSRQIIRQRLLEIDGAGKDRGEDIEQEAVIKKEKMMWRLACRLFSSIV
ncbi:hypothetical protein AK830_g2319 [Neonectria ditissima]|uniref:Uncharacterized protein n=1 Tax=Neonectria ditissima TaxID=78410 RepID=A0A0N8H8C6_9HYPO|nr:hypothetical protein AK830_g2319 [Neonectria ditissima]